MVEPGVSVPSVSGWWTRRLVTQVNGQLEVPYCASGLLKVSLCSKTGNAQIKVVNLGERKKKTRKEKKRKEKKKSSWDARNFVLKAAFLFAGMSTQVGRPA